MCVRRKDHIHERSATKNSILRVMKATLYGLMISLFSAMLSFSAAAQTLSSRGLSIQVQSLSGSGLIQVTLINTAQKQIRIWQDTNSWGSARWRVLIVRNKHLEMFYQDPDEDFAENMPTFDTINPQSRLRQTLDLNDGRWIGMTGRISLNAGDMIVVIYDVPFTNEALKLGVWCGVAACSAIVP